MDDILSDPHSSQFPVVNFSFDSSFLSVPLLILHKFAVFQSDDSLVDRGLLQTNVQKTTKSQN